MRIRTLFLAGFTAEAARQAETFQQGDEPRWRRLLAWGQQRAAGGTTPWSEDPATFRGWSLPAQASILVLRDTALDHALAQGAALASQAWRHMGLALGLVALALGLSIGAVLLLLRRVVSPLQAATEAMDRMAAGDLSVAVPGLDRQDELGRLAGAVETLRGAAIARAEMAEARVAEQSAKAAQAERINALVMTFEADAAEILRGVATAADGLETTAAELSATARDGTDQAISVAAASEQASVNVQTVAGSAEELGASIAEIARQVNAAAVVASRAAEETRQTDAAVQELSAAASRIIAQMESNTAAVAAAAEEQAAATQEIGRAVGEAAAGTQEAARHANGVRQGAERTGASATDLRAASGALAGQAAAMRSRVDGFLRQIRAA